MVASGWRAGSVTIRVASTASTARAADRRGARRQRLKRFILAPTVQKLTSSVAAGGSVVCRRAAARAVLHAAIVHAAIVEAID